MATRREGDQGRRKGTERKPLLERQFENRVCEGVRACKMAGNSVLCAVSGGADSMALATALARRASALKLNGLGIAHVDHQMRPSSGADARIVRNLAASLGIPFFVARVEVSSKGLGREAAARVVRYLALEELAVREGFQVVATGHTRTDQAETVLLRLLRGAGLRGLSGMAASRRLGLRQGLGSTTRLCRPLLALSREETRAYVNSLGLRIAEDESNQDRSILRNALRLDVWAALTRLEPALEPHLAELARQCREDEAVLDSLARAAATSLLKREKLGDGRPGPRKRSDGLLKLGKLGDGRLRLDARAVAALPHAIAIRLVRRAIARLRPAAQPSALHLRRIVDLCAKGGAGELHVAGNLIAELRKGVLRLGPRDGPGPEEPRKAEQPDAAERTSTGTRRRLRRNP